MCPALDYGFLNPEYWSTTSMESTYSSRVSAPAMTVFTFAFWFHTGLAAAARRPLKACYAIYLEFSFGFVS